MNRFADPMMWPFLDPRFEFGATDIENPAALDHLLVRYWSARIQGMPPLPWVQMENEARLAQHYVAMWHRHVPGGAALMTGHVRDLLDKQLAGLSAQETKFLRNELVEEARSWLTASPGPLSVPPPGALEEVLAKRSVVFTLSWNAGGGALVTSWPSDLLPEPFQIARELLVAGAFGSVALAGTMGTAEYASFIGGAVGGDHGDLLRWAKVGLAKFSGLDWRSIKATIYCGCPAGRIQYEHEYSGFSLFDRAARMDRAAQWLFPSYVSHLLLRRRHDVRFAAAMTALLKAGLDLALEGGAIELRANRIAQLCPPTMLSVGYHLDRP